MALVKCPACEKMISPNAEECPNCGEPMKKGVISCPNCRSTNVKKISGTSKVGSAVMFGVFSMGKITKSYECKSCKHRW
ncbi:hypothetical protein KQI38_03400 [Tissierella carlieri]|uniref:hypothetical protein n=1 Tax=Tissierella carlieri TaxID=689904 RepID=UPI001C102B8F|nr:hypothetical protein [Tissierella carlieri]MBU5311059.1 hypothetical protein [Tissierella carlieri]